MRIGLLGTGNVGRALATGWRAAGHDVLLGSRQPGERGDLGLPVAGLAETAAHAQVLVNATPGGASVDLLCSLGAGALAGLPLIDVGLSDDFTALAHPNSSPGEQIQEAFPRTPVVKTLCTMDSTAMVAARDGLTGAPRGLRPQPVENLGGSAGRQAGAGRDRRPRCRSWSCPPESSTTRTRAVTAPSWSCCTAWRWTRASGARSCRG
ncbi:NADPH-dependent F420 reductase [Streptomyces koyangensis]|uniref:NADPH-dependent F420 reductase n=1 Tax=Streptomyces koyangensis TaxID=188770 RepID=UPI00216B0E8A|nr:NAD(P)-binding domain-containing protein [Streptomyces koyangensis]